MKNFNTILLAASLLFATSCRAQMIKKLSDVSKLKENESIFIGKPLNTLLKEIKPQIRMASAQSNRADHMPSVIYFRFVDSKIYYKKEKGKSYASIVVYIKENFDWDGMRRSKKANYSWTKEDVEKFGSLTVVGIRVSDEN